MKSTVIKPEVDKVIRVLMSKAAFKVKYAILWGAMERVYNRGKIEGQLDKLN